MKKMPMVVATTVITINMKAMFRNRSSYGAIALKYSGFKALSVNSGIVNGRAARTAAASPLGIIAYRKALSSLMSGFILVVMVAPMYLTANKPRNTTAKAMMNIYIPMPHIHSGINRSKGYWGTKNNPAKSRLTVKVSPR